MSWPPPAGASGPQCTLRLLHQVTERRSFWATVLSSVQSQAKDTSGRQVATERQGTSQALELDWVGSRVHAQPSRWQLPREARG